MKALSFLLVFFATTGWLCAAETVPSPSAGCIILEAEHVEFNRVSGNVTATHSVALSYKGVTLNTEILHYNPYLRELEIPGAFSVTRSKINLQAEQLTYRFSLVSGEAYRISASIDRVHIKGEKIIFSAEKIEVREASFTTCDQDPNHYRIKSKTLYIYPELGFMVAFDNWIQAGVLPFEIWVPTFVYGSTYLLGAGAPIPQVGTTQREGAYVKTKIGYFVNPYSSGTVDVGYLSQLGVYGGVTHQVVLNELSQLGLSAHAVGSDGFEGGMIYTLGISPKTESRGETQLETWMHKFSDSVLPLSQFTLQYTFGELINDSRVDKTPVLGFAYNKLPVSLLGAETSGKVYMGHFLENSLDHVIQDHWQTNVDSEILKSYELGASWSCGLGLSFLGHWYDTGASWQRVLSRYSLFFHGPLNPEISFTKRILNDGKSPFDFENKYAVSDDEIGCKISQMMGTHALALEANYVIETHIFRNIDVVLGTHFHCWETNLRWNTVNGQLTFGVNLY